MTPRARWWLAGVSALALGGCAEDAATPASAMPGSATAASSARAFVGSAACAGCHERQYRDWRASHHAQAMQPETAATVLGDFATEVRIDGRRLAFSRAGGAPRVRLTSAAGEVTELPIRATLGVYPLQQYVVPLGTDLQVLDVGWDARDRAAGGQRWFAVQQPLPAPGEPTHWTGRAMNWNSQCAACHTTALAKNFDRAANRYETRFAEMGVGCEACHGPASAHLEWTRGGAADAARGFARPLDSLRAAPFAFDADHRDIAALHGDLTVAKAASQPCLGCHARRQELAATIDPDAPFLDAYLPELLEPAVYHEDGRVDAESFEFGSFAQSRMHEAGVTCAHCHDSHGAGLKATGNTLCAQCHAPARFDRREHHHHTAGSAGSACVACHMPGKVFMGVDLRRDHSLRAPDTDEPVRAEGPDACMGCHAARTAAWKHSTLREWWKARTLPARPEPTIRRASRLARAGAHSPTELAAAVRDTDAVLRLGAARALDHLPADEALRIGAPLLGDPFRAVRVSAARSMSRAPAGSVPAALRPALERALRELETAETLAADRPEGLLNLALLQQRTGRTDEAAATLEQAVARAPDFVPALVNLADLRRGQRRDDDARALLGRATALAPADPAPAYALGLLFIRRDDLPAALTWMERAHALAPGDRDIAAAAELLRARRTTRAPARVDRAPDPAPSTAH